MYERTVLEQTGKAKRWRSRVLGILVAPRWARWRKNFQEISSLLGSRHMSLSTEHHKLKYATTLNIQGLSEKQDVNRKALSDLNAITFMTKHSVVSEIDVLKWSDVTFYRRVHLAKPTPIPMDLLRSVYDPEMLWHLAFSCVKLNFFLLVIHENLVLSMHSSNPAAITHPACHENLIFNQNMWHSFRIIPKLFCYFCAI